MFWDNFIFYCAKNNKAPNAVAKELNLSSGSITAWKNGVKPRLTTLSKIADYFCVTIEDLTNGEKEKAAPISGNGFDEQYELFKRFNALDPDLKNLLYQVASLDCEGQQIVATLVSRLVKSQDK